jgi:hypothetical protein
VLGWRLPVKKEVATPTFRLLYILDGGVLVPKLILYDCGNPGVDSALVHLMCIPYGTSSAAVPTGLTIVGHCGVTVVGAAYNVSVKNEVN